MSRLTVDSWERLIRRHLEEHVPLRALAAHAGISLRTAYRWLARYRAGGTAALVDRRSVRHSQRRTLDPRQLQQMAYVEVLPDEQQSTTVGFLVRAGGWFSEQGMTCRRILSDNGSAYRSGAWRKACEETTGCPAIWG